MSNHDATPKADGAESLSTAGLGALPTMADALAAGDGVLLNEQAALLRECRLALDDLLRQKPMMTGLLCGSTTLGNLRAELYAYRPQGVFNGQAPNVQGNRPCAALCARSG
jgi:hypothetical protein